MTTTRPNFFIVGQPKSGTTAFFEFLKVHPQVHMAGRKELHYFCTDFHDENARTHGEPLHFPVRTEADYLGWFDGWEGQPIVGDASVHYLYSTVAAQNIARFAPDARILAFVREPVSFLQSWHAHSLLTNGETIESLEEALAAEPDRVAGHRIPAIAKVPSYLHYSRRVEYAAQLQRFYDVFPASRIKVIVYDDIVSDVGAVYRSIAEFLGIDEDFTPEFRRINERKRLRFKHLARAMKLPAVKRAMDTVLPKPVRRKVGLHRAYARLFLKQGGREGVDPGLRDELMARYRPEVARLSELLGRDLVSEWGYAAVPSGV